MTQPALDTDEQLSGRAADAIADIHDELRRRYSGLNDAEAALAEALLAAHATSEAGRQRLQDIQRQLVEAIANPVNALDTPAGERQFLMFLRGKIAEIQRVVDDGTLTARDQADLTRALANSYLADDHQPVLSPPPDRASTTSPTQQPAGAMPSPGMPAMPSALGGLPQAAAPGTAGLGAAASPLAGLASLLAGQDRTPVDENTDEPERDEVPPKDDDEGDDDEDDADDDDDLPATPDEAPTEEAGPAQTRPAAS